MSEEINAVLEGRLEDKAKESAEVFNAVNNRTYWLNDSYKALKTQLNSICAIIEEYKQHGNVAENSLFATSKSMQLTVLLDAIRSVDSAPAEDHELARLEYLVKQNLLYELAISEGKNVLRILKLPSGF